jgi:hypothetical protein
MPRPPRAPPRPPGPGGSGRSPPRGGGPETGSGATNQFSRLLDSTPLTIDHDIALGYSFSMKAVRYSAEAIADLKRYGNMVARVRKAINEHAANPAAHANNVTRPPPPQGHAGWFAVEPDACGGLPGDLCRSRGRTGGDPDRTAGQCVRLTENEHDHSDHDLA